MTDQIICEQVDSDALDASIERWEKIVEVGGLEYEWEDAGIPECALCELDDSRTEDDRSRNCQQCVVGIDTVTHCRGTPYVDAALGCANSQKAMLKYLIALRSRLVIEHKQPKEDM
jgi:hypothetical protein